MPTSEEKKTKRVRNEVCRAGKHEKNKKEKTQHSGTKKVKKGGDKNFYLQTRTYKNRGHRLRSN